MDTKLLAEQIVNAVRARLGKNEPAVEKLMADEVAQLIAGQGAHGHHAPPQVQAAPSPDSGVLTDRVVVSANGRNRGGIVAGLTAVISDFQGDIRDISQTIIGDYFTMIIVVDVAGATHKGARFSELKARLEEAGRALGTHVVALHDDLLTAMHSV